MSNNDNQILNTKIVNSSFFYNYKKSLMEQHLQKKEKINTILSIIFTFLFFILYGGYLYYLYITKKTPAEKYKEKLKQEFLERYLQHQIENDTTGIHDGNKLSRLPTKLPKPYFQVDLLPFVPVSS